MRDRDVKRLRGARTETCRDSETEIQSVNLHRKADGKSRVREEERQNTQARGNKANRFGHRGVWVETHIRRD